jgi:cytochrome P450
MDPNLDVDFFAPEVRADPWPFYARLREADPVHRRPDGDWILTRYADCQGVLADPRCSSNPAHESRPSEGSPARQAGSNLLLFLDPPDHTRLRRLVSKAFTPRRVEELRPRIAELVDALLDEVDGEPTFNLLEALAFPLPVIVICELMGVPAEDRDSLKEWSTAASRLLDPDVEGETLELGLLAGMGLAGYFDALFEERRRQPQDDLVSGLVAAEEEGDRLSADELRAITVLLFIAGHETTMNLIGNGTYALLQQPANRDPAQYPDPDRLDVTREDNRHLTFSHGIHFCLGASLARVEGQVAIPRLLQRFPDLALAAEPSYREHLVLRGLTELQVAIG